MEYTVSEVINHEISSLLLVLGLFLPRLSLFLCWILGIIPYNTMPFVGDVFMSILVPRALILFYIYENMGIESGWFVLHCIAWAISLYIYFQTSDS